MKSWPYVALPLYTIFHALLIVLFSLGILEGPHNVGADDVISIIVPLFGIRLINGNNPRFLQEKEKPLTVYSIEQ